MNYQLGINGFVVRLDDNTWIPPDPNNRDRVEYEKWLAEGNTPLPTPEEGKL